MLVVLLLQLKIVAKSWLIVLSAKVLLSMSETTKRSNAAAISCIAAVIGYNAAATSCSYSYVDISCLILPTAVVLLLSVAVLLLSVAVLLLSAAVKLLSAV